MELLNKLYLKVIKFFSSPKTALILLIHLTVFSIIAVLFPSIQSNGYIKSYSEIFNYNSYINSFNFQEKFNNNIILTLLITCCTGILFSSYFRLKSEFKNHINRLNSKIIQPFNDHSYISNIVKILKDHNYNVLIKSDKFNTIISGEKGKIGLFGSVIFHLSLILLCMGIFFSTFASLRGSFNLTEGENFNKYLNLSRGKFYTKDSSIVPLKLISYLPELEVNGSFTEAAVVEYMGNGLRQVDTIFINNPLNLGDKKIYLGSKVGYSPYIEIINRNGEKVFQGYLRLASTKIGNTTYNKDYIYLDTVKVEFEFLPAVKTENIRNRTFNPALLVKINNEQRIFTLVGERREINDYTISYYGFRRWVSFELKHDTGIMVIFWAAIIGSLGLTLRFLFVKKKIVVNLYQKDRIFFDIALFSEKFFSIYKDELMVLSMQIEKSLLSLIGKDEPEINMVEEN